MEELTKENFWDEIYKKYPVEFKKFADWIDGYKKKNNWGELFAPPYHYLPKAMQIGIFMEFASLAKEVYGVDDIQLLPEVDSDVEAMHTYESMPDLIRGFFFNIERELSYKHRD